MAENQDGSEKTEQPTGKRISQAREDGMVPKSNDLSQVLGMTAAFVGLQFIAPYLWDDLVLVVKGGLSGEHVGDESFTIENLRTQFYGLIVILLPEIMALMVVAALFGAGSMALQTKFLWSNKLVKPKLSNLNPIGGLKRIFSANGMFNTAKSVAKLGVIAPVAYFAFFEIFPELLGLMDVPLNNLFAYTGSAASLIFWRIVSLLLVLAIIDYAWNFWRTTEQLKMTKAEVKDERKAIEGDEQTKRTIRAKGLQRAHERMMAGVPQADVVVTNPTHIAVALKYDITPGSAPKVIAKGRGYVAERIKKIAREAGIPVLERKPLARALYKAVEIGQQIPYELYAAIAEVLAYVYRIKGKNPFAHRSQETAQP